VKNITGIAVQGRKDSNEYILQYILKVECKTFSSKSEKNISKLLVWVQWKRLD